MTAAALTAAANQICVPASFLRSDARIRAGAPDSPLSLRPRAETTANQRADCAPCARLVASSVAHSCLPQNRRRSSIRWSSVCPNRQVRPHAKAWAWARASTAASSGHALRHLIAKPQFEPFPRQAWQDDPPLRRELGRPHGWDETLADVWCRCTRLCSNAVKASEQWHSASAVTVEAEQAPRCAYFSIRTRL